MTTPAAMTKIPTTAELSDALAALDEIEKEVLGWCAMQRAGLAKIVGIAERAVKVAELTGITGDDAPAASAPETRETIAADPHVLDDFHGQKVPRSSRIEMVTETHWRGWLGESEFEGAPDSVAASLRQAAQDAASFVK